MNHAVYAYNDYDAKPDPSHRPLYIKSVQAILSELPRGAAVLDAGCGGGDFSVGIAEAGLTVYGCDMSPTGVAAAQARGIGTFLQTSIYEPLAPAFGRDSFDAIICIEVIEHLYSPKAFAVQAMEALRPGGLMIVTTPYWGYLKNLVLALTNRTDRSLTALWEGGHIKHFSRKTLTMLMRNQGFEVLGFEGTGETWRHKLPFLWSGMLMTFRKPTAG